MEPADPEWPLPRTGVLLGVHPNRPGVCARFCRVGRRLSHAVGLQVSGANEGLALSMAAATNALRLDEGLADAHTSLGHARLHALDWDGAEREFMRAIQLSSGYAP